MLDANAGKFTFEIPLSFLFNFSEQYDKVIFNCRHALKFIRQTTYIPIHKSVYNTTDTALNISDIIWYIPIVTPSASIRESLEMNIANNVKLPIHFMNRKLDMASIPVGSTNFNTTIYYETGVEKPRYIACAFQIVDTSVPATSNDSRNINYGIFNLCGHVSQPIGNNVAVGVQSINVLINGKRYILMDDNNSFGLNKMARWYHEYRKFKHNYFGVSAEKDMINYQDFRNLYRIYVIDISKQTESLLNTGVANVSLQFNFENPIAANTTVKLFMLSLYDRERILLADGQRQYVYY